jgi:hypothetical protein
MKKFVLATYSREPRGGTLFLITRVGVQTVSSSTGSQLGFPSSSVKLIRNFALLDENGQYAIHNCRNAQLKIRDY